MTDVIQLDDKLRQHEQFQSAYKRFLEHEEKGRLRFIDLTDLAVQEIWNLEGYKEVEHDREDIATRAVGIAQEEYLERYGICGDSPLEALKKIKDERERRKTYKKVLELETEMVRKLKEVEKLMSQRRELVGI